MEVFLARAATVWSFSYADDSGDIFLVLLDEKALTWTQYYENPSEGIPLSEINFGRLLKSGARAGGPSIMAPRAGR